MTIGSDRRCRRPKRSTSPRDEARSPHLDARKKIKQKHRTKFRVQFLSPGWRRPDCNYVIPYRGESAFWPVAPRNFRGPQIWPSSHAVAATTKITS